MEKWFGNPVGEEGPIQFLQSHGYVLRRDWYWDKPTPSHNISEDEWQCIAFLIDEWDFGGIAPQGEPITRN